MLNSVKKLTLSLLFIFLLLTLSSCTFKYFGKYKYDKVIIDLPDGYKVIRKLDKFKEFEVLTGSNIRVAMSKKFPYVQEHITFETTVKSNDDYYNEQYFIKQYDPQIDEDFTIEKFERYTINNISALKVQTRYDRKDWYIKIIQVFIFHDNATYVLSFYSYTESGYYLFKEIINTIKVK